MDYSVKNCHIRSNGSQREGRIKSAERVAYYPFPRLKPGKRVNQRSGISFFFASIGIPGNLFWGERALSNDFLLGKS